MCFCSWPNLFYMWHHCAIVTWVIESYHFPLLSNGLVMVKVFSVLGPFASNLIVQHIKQETLVSSLCSTQLGWYENGALISEYITISMLFYQWRLRYLQSSFMSLYHHHHQILVLLVEYRGIHEELPGIAVSSYPLHLVPWSCASYLILYCPSPRSLRPTSTSVSLRTPI